MNKRLILDITMTVLMPALMAYALIGETFHELAGIFVFVLFVIHHYLNRNYLKNVFKGKYNVRRIVQLMINLIIFVLMILQPITGILMSKHILRNITIKGFTMTARSLHLCVSYWLYLFLSIHAGMHMRPLYLKYKKRFMIPIIVVSLYGILTFIHRSFIDYMFMRVMFAFFDYSQPLFYFLFDYLCIMFVFMMVGIGLAKISAIPTKK